MPPRKRRCTPQPLEAKEAEPKLLLSAEVQKLLDNVEEQVQERVENMLALASGMQQAIRQNFTLKLMQLPKQVRDMPLKVFKEQYGADIKSVMLKDMEDRLAASMAATKLPATGLRTRGGATGLATQRKTRARAAETPALGISSTGLPSTILRAPAVNETIYSARGSPLGILQGSSGGQTMLQTAMKDGTVLNTQLRQQQPAGQTVTTVVPPKKPGSKMGVPESMTFTLKDGQQVVVDFDGGLEKIPKDQQEEVTELYHAHMDGLNKFAAAFRKKAANRR